MALTEKAEDRMSLTEHTEGTEKREEYVGFGFFRKARKTKPTIALYESQSTHVNRREPDRCGRKIFAFRKKIPANSLPSALSSLFSGPSVSSSELGERVRCLRCSSAFSLIEVLVSMTILIVIVVMVTNMFRNASEAWDTGTQRAEMNTAARAAMEYISRELSCAVAGSIVDSQGVTKPMKRFKLEYDNVIKQTKNLSFIALSGDDQALRGIRFRYDQNDGHFIETCHKTDTDFDRYDALDWDSSSKDNWQGIALLITNVWRFVVTVCANENDMMNGIVADAYDSSVPANSDLLPACVDISIEMLGERDMARALSGLSDQAGFVMTNSRVYTTRVCFPNRGSR